MRRACQLCPTGRAWAWATLCSRCAGIRRQLGASYPRRPWWPIAVAAGLLALNVGLVVWAVSVPPAAPTVPHAP
jgi:hypothetical protein